MMRLLPILLMLAVLVVAGASVAAQGVATLNNRAAQLEAIHAQSY